MVMRAAESVLISSLSLADVDPVSLFPFLSALAKMKSYPSEKRE